MHSNLYKCIVWAVHSRSQSLSPQRSNRAALIEGTIRCLDRLPADQVTARAIAKESGANLSSINHHFGSKDALITEAIVTGLDRWLEEISNRLSSIGPKHPWTRFLTAAEAVESTRRNHGRLATSFVAALARAPHDPAVRSVIRRGVSRTRPEIARLIDLGEDEVGSDAGGLVLSMFYGLLLQDLIDPELGIEGTRLEQAMLRLIDTVGSGDKRSQPGQSSG